MRARRSVSILCLALGAIGLLGVASRLEGEDVKLPNLELRDTKLDNGLRVILVPRTPARPFLPSTSLTTSGAATSVPGIQVSRTFSST